MDQAEFDQQLRKFLRDHLSPMMDRAAEDDIDSGVAVFGLLEMASMVLRFQDEATARAEFEDYVSRFLNDWRGKT